MTFAARVRRIVRRAKHRILIVAEILRHPGTPWYVWAAAFAVLAYAASPIDLIPDFIPFVGLLDDLLLLPLGVALVFRLTPRNVRRDAARAALRAPQPPKLRSRWIAAAAILLVWVLVAALVIRGISGGEALARGAKTG